MAAAFWRAGESVEHTGALFTTASPGFGLCQAGCAACSLAAGHQEAVPWRWTAGSEAGDGSCLVQMARKRGEGAGQRAHPPLWSPRPVCLPWCQTSGCELSQIPAAGLRLEPFQLLAPCLEAARVGRADVRPTWEEEMSKTRPVTPFV